MTSKTNMTSNKFAYDFFPWSNDTNSSQQIKNIKPPPKRSNRPTKRTTFTSEQVTLLELEFAKNEYICKDRRGELAQTIELTECQVKTWFQNRRTKKRSSELKFGTACSENKTSTKWYYDSKLLFCYPYKYLGCGEGSNSFESNENCLESCKPADQFSCGGNTGPDGVCFAHGDQGCKKGTVCVMGGMVGFCCDKKIQVDFANIPKNKNISTPAKAEPRKKQPVNELNLSNLSF
nr:hypothetical protein C02F12.5 - Caenorhabditis elegans [Caenorhabditis elegans]